MGRMKNVGKWRYGKNEMDELVKLTVFGKLPPTADSGKVCGEDISDPMRRSDKYLKYT